MSSLGETKAVLRSLDAFDALRVGLGYLRSITVCFAENEESRSRMSSLMVSHAMAADGSFRVDQAEKLANSYFWMIIPLMYSLLDAALQHYVDVIKSNPQLKHQEMEATLQRMRDCGLMGALRQLRNAVFHIRPNKNVDKLIEEVHKLANENGIVMSQVEKLLYDSTEQVFLGTEIYRTSREELEKGFQEALAYYREHLAERGRNSRSRKNKTHPATTPARIAHPRRYPPPHAARTRSSRQLRRAVRPEPGRRAAPCAISGSSPSRSES